MTDYQGIEVENLAEDRIEPVSGDDLYLSLDYNIQCYVQQAAKKVLKAKKGQKSLCYFNESTKWRNLCPRQPSRV
mgnify:CR=1 FL=1